MEYKNEWDSPTQGQREEGPPELILIYCEVLPSWHNTISHFEGSLKSHCNLHGPVRGHIDGDGYFLSLTQSKVSRGRVCTETQRYNYSIFCVDTKITFSLLTINKRIIFDPKLFDIYGWSPTFTFSFNIFVFHCRSKKGFNIISLSLH